jgi:hypothetical protein
LGFLPPLLGDAETSSAWQLRVGLFLSSRTCFGISILVLEHSLETGLEDLEPRILKRLLQTLIHPDHHFGGISDFEEELGIVLNVEPFHLLLHPVHIPGHI